MKDEVEGKGLSIGYPKNNYSGFELASCKAARCPSEQGQA